MTVLSTYISRICRDLIDALAYLLSLLPSETGYSRQLRRFGTGGTHRLPGARAFAVSQRRRLRIGAWRSILILCAGMVAIPLGGSAHTLAADDKDDDRSARASLQGTVV